jgi:hypothetical protein
MERSDTPQASAISVWVMQPATRVGLRGSRAGGVIRVRRHKGDPRGAASAPHSVEHAPYQFRTGALAPTIQHAAV